MESKEINLESSVKEARVFLQKNWTKSSGAKCPCCNQKVKMYARKFNATMAYGLLLMYDFGKIQGFDNWVKMNEEIASKGIPSSNIEYAKLRYWGLAEEKPNKDESKKDSGYWRITTKGRNFANNYISIESHLMIYNNKVVAKHPKNKTVSITEALGKRFNYTEMMRGIFK